MLEVEYLPIDEIEPYPGNAKLHPAEQIEQIKKSIEEFGFNDPVAIWKNGEIIEGHGRVIAARELGIEELPVIRLDDLTDEQRRAYILVHNKLTMNSGFDVDLLALEVEDLQEVDLDSFGFDVEKILEDGLQDLDGWYGDERERTNNAYNLDIAHETEMTEDFWQMPVIQKCDFVPNDLVGFNYAKTNKDKNVGIHFYVDDYQFERIWNAPEKYIDILSEYDCILTPDFSLYMDMPMPMKIWNVYRSRQIGAFFQNEGISVIPTLQWAEPETFCFCFQGIEKGGVVSVSTIGVKRDSEAMDIWYDGMDEAIRQIEPSTILLYGGDIGYDFGDIRVIEYDNKVTKNWKGK